VRIATKEQIANDGARAFSENIKRSRGFLRQNGSTEPKIKRVEIVIAKDYDSFDDYDEDMLRHALAHFLRVSEKDVRIVAKKPGSIRVSLLLPADSVNELKDAFINRRQALQKALPLFPIKELFVERELLKPVPHTPDLPQQGTIKWFNNAKGYGFIQPELGGEEIFVHHTAIAKGDFRTLNEGEQVSFEVVSGPKGLRATNVVRSTFSATTPSDFPGTDLPPSKRPRGEKEVSSYVKATE
jgi:cold shock protein